MTSLPEDLPRLKREYARRSAIRASLEAWAGFVLKPQGFRIAAHQRHLIGALEAVARGEVDRLLLLMPPGSAKSTYVSVLFPPWWFVRHPSSSVIAASHTEGLAAHFGRQGRALIEAHGRRLGYGLRAGGATQWETTRRGQYLATGVHGSIIGRRADLAIIDDPVKSQAEAESARAREYLWDWYRSDVVTRLRPGGRVILAMTRWHEDDLGGRLLARESGDWRCIRLPALATADDPLGRAPGEALWPEWEDAAALERKRASVGERAWFAQFQQEPRPEGGTVFRVERIAILDTADTQPGGPVVRAWDLAATEAQAGNNPDWTVGLKLARERSGRFVVLDLVRLRGDAHTVQRTMRRVAELDGDAVPISVPQDPGQAGKAQMTLLANVLAGYRMTSSREAGSKEARAALVAVQVDAGNFGLLRAAWNTVLLDELRSFPHGTKDDQVDALSRAFAALTETGPGVRRTYVGLFSR
jgi:predicted phage terminase large subunit-like protein